MPGSSAQGGNGVAPACHSSAAHMLSEQMFPAQATCEGIWSRGARPLPFRPMKIAFLGTGSASSLERYNGAVVVAGRLLLDGGAPLLPHMHRLGIDPGGIEALFLTHFHGDHVLGLPTFMLHRAFVASGGLSVVGPPGVERRLEGLFHVAWGDEWRKVRELIGLTYHEAGASGEVAGLPYQAGQPLHGGQDS